MCEATYTGEARGGIGKLPEKRRADAMSALSRTRAWCPGEDSNSHGFTRQPLKLVCLPVPPPGRTGSGLLAPLRRFFNQGESASGLYFLGGAVGAAGPLVAAGAGVAGVSFFGAPSTGTAAPPVA